MSREIKFRAWDKELNEMQDTMTAQDVWQDGRNYELGKTSVFGNTNFRGVEQRTINDFVLMQYTGLKDKNGKEIYEGDILRWIDWREELTEIPDVYRIDWLKDEARFSLNCFRGGKQIDPKEDMLELNDTFEVIGNIYENGELLDEQATRNTKSG